VVAPDVPAERIDESDLIDQMEKGAKHNSNIETRKANRNQAVQDIAAKLEKGLQLRAEAERIIAEADKLAQEAGQLKAKLESAPPLPEPIDLSVLRQKIAGAKGINQAISDKEKKTQFLADAERIEAEAKKLTDNIAEREAGKMLSISIAQLPVEGIAFGDGEVLMNGVPLDQASDAEKIKISVAIAMALNPKLKVIRIRDGSLLDASSMKIIADMAAEKDFQIWVEKVDESGKIGFVIEDGQLKTENKLQEKTAI